MKILHLNSNFDRSTIYSNMNRKFRGILNDQGNVYFPTRNTSKFILGSNEECIDFRKIINKSDLLISKKRNHKLYNDLNNNYELKNYNGILAYSLFSNGSLAYEINQKHSIPYSVIVQNTDVNFHFKKIPFSINKGNKILENATKIIFLSETYLNEVINSFVNKRDMIREKSIVIPFGIDDFWKENTVVRNKTYHQPLNLLYVGKINRNKNITTILELANILNQEGIKTHLNLVGMIEDEKIGRTIKNNKNTTWLPYVESQKSLMEIYRSNDIFIMPSYKESFGLVYAEAMSQGLPVIYTKGQGFDKHFVDGDIGYSVKPEDIENMKEKIKLILKNYEETSFHCITGVQKFYWESIVDQYKNEVFSF